MLPGLFVRGLFLSLAGLDFVFVIAGLGQGCGEEACGAATMPRPMIRMREVKMRPPAVMGKASPYPTVVRVTMAHQRE